ncbi:hypothetical protein ANN_09343 [Periplaneta americana]|uniref:DUF4817 domain-containing protein n=1 Tax=Periplaneta americana TaxID=6978 RepID=A0ABQ8TL29_PERAM|nr:hypothetical protein ANN_09343 [Periplaneta americana]
MTPLCTLLKSGSDVLVQTFNVLVYRPWFLGYVRKFEIRFRPSDSLFRHSSKVQNYLFLNSRLLNEPFKTLMKIWSNRLCLFVYVNYKIHKLFSTFCVNVKMQYTLNQRLFLVKQYWITNSIIATQRAYQREFGVHNPPKRNTILGLVNKLETTGSLTFVFEFVEQLDDVELSQGYFQQDGATCHTSNESMELIASFFDDRIISRNLWPPRSPDLTTPDFFPWGYLKDRVYATRPLTLDDLKHNITQEIQAIDNRVNVERRVELCLMQDGGHFQHLL